MSTSSSATSSTYLHDLMSIIDKYKRNMSSIDYMHAYNSMKSLHLDKGDNSATSYKSRPFPSEMRDFTTDRLVCRDSLEALDEFVSESKMNMELDILQKRYILDLRMWEEKKDVNIPRSYEIECVALFRIENHITSDVNDEWTIDDLRKAGQLKDDISDAEFLSNQFQKLDLWYESNMKVDLISANRAWSKFSRSKSFMDVMDIIQESVKAIEWRRRIHLQRRKELVFSEIDAEHDGFNVYMPWIQIIPERDDSN